MRASQKPMAVPQTDADDQTGAMFNGSSKDSERFSGVCEAVSMVSGAIEQLVLVVQHRRENCSGLTIEVEGCASAWQGGTSQCASLSSNANYTCVICLFLEN